MLEIFQRRISFAKRDDEVEVVLLAVAEIMEGLGGQLPPPPIQQYSEIFRRSRKFRRWDRN